MTAKKKEFLFWWSGSLRSLYFLPCPREERTLSVTSLSGGIDYGRKDLGGFYLFFYETFSAWVGHPSLYVLSGSVFLAAMAMPWVISAKFPSYIWYYLPIAFFSFGAAVGLVVFTRLKYYGAIFLLIIVMMAGGFFYTLRVIFPLSTPYKSARFICQEITSRIQPGEKLALYGDFETGSL